MSVVPSNEASEESLQQSNYYDQVAKNQVIFDEEFGLLPRSVRRSTKQVIASRVVTSSSILDTLLNFIPILRWLPQYNIRLCLLNDIIGGLTVGIINVPQGMAYASLAGLSPVHGLYTSFFPAIVYMLFGTSRHNSLGVFAVVSLMVGSTNIRLTKLLNGNMTDTMDNDNLTALSIQQVDAMSEQTQPIDIVMALTLCVGLIQLTMAVLRLDFLTAYMSDQVIKGFTTGAAVHVLVAQLNKVLGIPLPRYSGLGRIFKMLNDILVHLPTANAPTVVTSAVTMVILYVCKNQVAPRLNKYITVPIPFELFAIVIGTSLSYVLDMQHKFNMDVVGEIPLGLPAPSLPKIELLPYVFGDALAIAIIVLAVTVSMAKLFANKHGYSIDVRQEFYALGITECVTSLFPCFTSSTALTRSLICEAAGTKTQLATVFSSLLMLLVIFVLGVFVKVLPVCFLACIILVALKGMLVQLCDLPRLWPISKVDFSIWLFTFLSTVVCDVIQGLAMGILFALLMVVFRTQRTQLSRLGRMSHAEGAVYYRAVHRYRDARYVDQVCCVQWTGPLLFLNVERFKHKCHRLLTPPSQTYKSHSIAAHETVQTRCHVNLEAQHNNASVISVRLDDDQKQMLTLHSFKGASAVKDIVVDLSSVPYVDVMGAAALKDVYRDMKQQDVNLFYCNAQLCVLEFIKRCEYEEALSVQAAFYPSTEDAVHAINLLRDNAATHDKADIAAM